MSSSVLKKIKRYVTDGRINLVKNEEGFFVFYLDKFEDKHNIKRWKLLNDVDAWLHKGTQTMEKTDLGWQHSAKISERWLNDERIEALERIIQEKAESIK
jgi:hypothetical protein